MLTCLRGAVFFETQCSLFNVFDFDRRCPTLAVATVFDGQRWPSMAAVRMLHYFFYFKQFTVECSFTYNTVG